MSLSPALGPSPNHAECWSLFLPSIQVPLDNHIPEKTGLGSWVPTEPKELEENEVIPKRMSPFDGEEDVSNKVSMSSTAQGSNIFERTEVLAGKVPCVPQDTPKLGEGFGWGRNRAAGKHASSPLGNLVPLPYNPWVPWGLEG